MASRKDVAAGERLKTEIASFESNVTGWARRSGNLVTVGLGGLGGLLVLGAWILVGVIAIWNPLDMTMLGIIPGVFAITAMPLLKTGSGTKRTAQGRDLWSRIGGFHRVLSTPSSQDRFDFSGRQELYTQYIPWAVALDCADEWAAKYRTEMGAEPPAPSYFGSYYGAGTGVLVKLDGQRLRLDRQQCHLLVRGDPVVVLQRRRRVLRRRRWRRRWRRLVVGPAENPIATPREERTT